MANAVRIAGAVRKDRQVVEAMRTAMKAGRNNESILISNIEDFVPAEVRLAYDRLIDAAVLATLAEFEK